MAEVEFISHSGGYNHDMVETERFYSEFLGAPHARMSGSRTCVLPGGYQILFFLPEARMATRHSGNLSQEMIFARKFIAPQFGQEIVAVAMSFAACRRPRS